MEILDLEQLSLTMGKIQHNLDAGIITEEEAEEQINYYLRNNDIDLADMFMLDEMILSMLENEKKGQ